MNMKRQGENTSSDWEIKLIGDTINVLNEESNRLKNRLNTHLKLTNYLIRSWNEIIKIINKQKLTIEKVTIANTGSIYITFNEKNEFNKQYVIRFSTHNVKRNHSAILKNYILEE